MSFTMDKIIKAATIIGANGAGPSTSSGIEIKGSWLTEILAWLGNAIVNVATVVWGWLIYLFYTIIKWCLNIIDILQMFVEKLVGIDAYNQEGGLSAVEKLEDTDIIIRFITNKTILKLFGTIAILGLALLVIFSILALIKQNYQSAVTEGADGVKKPVDVLKKAGKGIFMCLLIPFLLVMGILGSNAVLASVCNSIKGDNDLTIGGIIFTASAYEANKFREYATDGLRVPITQDSSTEIVYPGDYTTREDMQVLFYKLATGKVYIEYISESDWFKTNSPNFAIWTDVLTEDDVKVTSTKINGNAAFSQFNNHFNAFYNEFCRDGNHYEPLADKGMLDPIIRSIYNSNWTRNKAFKDLTFNFDSTYVTQSDVYFGSMSGEQITASIIVNSPLYSAYESFATTELEYFVMADLLDYAVEHNQTFYYVNAGDPSIKWSNIIVDPTKDPVNIGDYDAQTAVYSQPSDIGKNYGIAKYSQNALEGKTLQQFVASYAYNATLEADSAFVVRYYNGVNRLYWSKDGATSEETGATYIICVKDETDGMYVPVTQETTKFKSNFLADDYTGAIVARGIFETENLIPKDYCLPTAIVEQIVDDYGNELKNIDKLSPFALGDTFQMPEQNFTGFMAEFCGTLSRFGSLGANLLEGAFKGLNALGNLETKSLLNNMMNQLGEDRDTDGKILKDGTGNDIELLVNPNINGYSYIYGASGAPESVVFYDSNGRKISAGAGADNPDQTQFALKDRDQKSAYVLIQKTSFGDIVIPYYFADTANLAKFITTVLGSEVRNKEHTFLAIKYTYDNIQVQVATNKSYRMLLNFNAVSLVQLNNEGKVIEKTSGEFVVTDSYGLINKDSLQIEKVANLVISGGEVFYANGTEFFTKKDAANLYFDFADNYLKGILTNSVVNWIGEGISSVQFMTMLTALNIRDDIKSLLTTLESGGKVIMEDGKIKLIDTGGTSKDILTSEVFVQNIMASDFRAGVAAMITEYDRAYYSIHEEPVITEEGETPQVNGTINFYNKNNQEITEQKITYTQKEKVENQKITMRVAVVMGAGSGEENKYTSNVSYATIVNANTNSYKVPLDNFISAEDNSLELKRPDFINRWVWFYDVTYDVDYWKYLSDTGETKAVLGTTLDNLEIKYAGYAYRRGESGLEVANADTQPSADFLTVKNNSVYCAALGKYVVTPSGVKNMIGSRAENTDPTTGYNGIAYEITGMNEQGAYNTASAKTADFGAMNSELLTIQSQSEYDNVYIYFLRGNFAWNLLFDFTIMLPTINWAPLHLKFVFRCRLGTAYNYTEDVVYRLQNGMFYLDYNFRNSTGIAVENLYRMGAINPLILIFSTVLVLSIIWGVVWGLIRRIYDIVLLFIMLPAVCSTMPMDDGSRFKKWTEEVIEQVLKAYSVLITLNIYFVLCPMIKDVTTNLITAGDIPSTITGMFTSVTAGFSSFISNITSIGGNLMNIGSLSIGSGNLLGNIGFSNILLEAAELTTAEQAMLGHVNIVVYIMFFLVLTTMLKNGQELINRVLELTSLESGVYDEVKGNAATVASKAVRPVQVVAKGAANLAKGVGNLGKKAISLLGPMGGDGPEAKPERPSPEEPLPPDIADPGVPTTAEPVAEETPETGLAETVEEATEEATEEIAAEEEMAAEEQPQEQDNNGELTGDEAERFEKLDADYGELSDGELDGMADEFKSELEDKLAAVLDSTMQTGFTDADGKVLNADEFDAANADAQSRLGAATEVLSGLDRERQEMQSAGTFTGDAKKDWEERNKAAAEQKKAAEEDMSKLAAYSHVYNNQREEEEKLKAAYGQEIDDIEFYKQKRAEKAAGAEGEEEAKATSAETAETAEKAEGAETADSGEFVKDAMFEKLGIQLTQEQLSSMSSADIEKMIKEKAEEKGMAEELEEKSTFMGHELLENDFKGLIGDGIFNAEDFGFGDRAVECLDDLRGKSLEEVKKQVYESAKEQVAGDNATLARLRKQYHISSDAEAEAAFHKAKRNAKNNYEYECIRQEELEFKYALQRRNDVIEKGKSVIETKEKLDAYDSAEHFRMGDSSVLTQKREEERQAANERYEKTKAAAEERIQKLSEESDDAVGLDKDSNWASVLSNNELALTQDRAERNINKLAFALAENKYESDEERENDEKELREFEAMRRELERERQIRKSAGKFDPYGENSSYVRDHDPEARDKKPSTPSGSPGGYPAGDPSYTSRTWSATGAAFDPNAGAAYYTTGAYAGSTTGTQTGAQQNASSTQHSTSSTQQNASTTQTSGTATAQPKEKGFKATLKKIGKVAGIAALAMVVPPPITLAAVGGRLAVKGVKKLAGKTNSYLGTHPKAKAMAKYLAASMVFAPAGVVMAAADGVKRLKKKGNNAGTQTGAGSSTSSSTGGSQSNQGGNATSAQQNASSTQNSASSTQQNASSTQNSASSAQQNASSTQNSASSAQQNASSTQNSASSTQQNASSTQNSAAAAAAAAAAQKAATEAAQKAATEAAQTAATDAAKAAAENAQRTATQAAEKAATEAAQTAATDAAKAAAENAQRTATEAAEKAAAETAEKVATEAAKKAAAETASSGKSEGSDSKEKQKSAAESKKIADLEKKVEGLQTLLEEYKRTGKKERLEDWAKNNRTVLQMGKRVRDELKEETKIIFDELVALEKELHEVKSKKTSTGRRVSQMTSTPEPTGSGQDMVSGAAAGLASARKRSSGGATSAPKKPKNN